MTESILNSTKKKLGIAEDYNAFDLDVITHINTAFSVLSSLGIGPPEGFAIVDESATWDAFFGSDPRKNSIKTIVYLRVRLLFDPPATSYLIKAQEDQLKELTWRLQVQREEEVWMAQTESS